ncbi:HAD-like domain-containing protein [Gymnopilus junonius]|uniref:HAD-like domain-containing protein n=1 Tax=Gymnopilus junonius TaxID=109634 RepID=A0A9P5NDJ1_GYMJU|nr:HAD-like domain-containing protein [Gymnopilus junonius]
MSTHTFYADAVLFDMDGTLTDSIAAVEAAWSKVAKDIGQDPDYVIAATHGKRAVDNLSHFKPHLKDHEIEREVERFEESILYFADAQGLHGHLVPPREDDSVDSPISTPGSPIDIGSSLSSSIADTPDLTPGTSAPLSRASSFKASDVRRPSFGARLRNMLSLAARLRVYDEEQLPETIGDEDAVQDMADATEKNEKAEQHALEAWQLEAASVDRSVRILPGVRKMIDSIPAGRYAVATSGAKTYAYGCMKRVGIQPPPVTITADDKRLKAGKPAPDPFLLAAECLGYEASRCVVFEDSPSGIRAGVASGATVIAVCTSHERSKIEGCGAHYIVENMEKVQCEQEEDGRLKFSVEL